MNDFDENRITDISVLNDTVAISPYDPMYPVSLLSEGIQHSFNDAQIAADSIYNRIVENASIGSGLSQMKKTSHYVVEMSEDTMHKIDAGVLKLSTSKDGNTYAQLLDADNKFGAKFPIKKEDVVAGFDPVQMTMALQMKAMQDQLENIAKQIQYIDHNVKEVLQGQQNDRIGMYYSGLSLYVEAKNIADAELRKNLIAQSLRALSDASFQIQLNMQNDIKYLLSGEYKFAKGKRVQLIDERMKQINHEFSIVHQTALLKAGIYCNEKEYSAMAITLDEYSRFIETNIKANANYLSQFDHSDNGTEKGTWEVRANLKFDTNDLKQLEQKEKVLYLGVKKEKE